MARGITLSSLQDKKLEYMGKKAVVRAVNEATQELFIEREGHHMFMRPFVDLLEEIKKGKITIIQELAKAPSMQGATSEQLLEINRREKYFYAMLAKKYPTKDVERLVEDIQREANDTIGYARSTLCKDFKKFKRDGYSAAPQVLNNKRNRDAGLTQDVDDLVWEYLYKHHLKENGKSVAATQRLLAMNYEELGYEGNAPCAKTLMRRARSLGPYEYDRLRYGESYAKNKYKQKLEKYDITIPLDRVELDMAHFNVGIVKFVNGKKYYRGTVSMALVFDVGTASLLGYAIQVGKNKEASSYVVASIHHAINRKPDPTYIQHGCMRLAVMDAGTAYRSAMTKSLLQKIQGVFETTEVRKPCSKGFVENFVNRLRLEFFQGLEGYCGPFDPSRYSEANIKKDAKYTFEQFHQKFTNYVRDYHNSQLKRLHGLTPNEAWIKGTEVYPVLEPSDIPELRKYRGLEIDVTYNIKYGTTYDYQYFNSPELKAMYAEYCIATEKDFMPLTLLVDLNDASSVSVVVPRIVSPNPDEIVLLSIPNTNRSAFGKSFNELSVIEGRCEVLDGATTFLEDHNLSGYRSTPKHGDLIDITHSQDSDLSEDEVNTEIDEIINSAGVDFKAEEQLDDEELKSSDEQTNKHFDDAENKKLGVSVDD
ncbi:MULTISPECIES: hypothetical protein [unclassified Pseudoalteromonas]|uniref:hypothetical protein n=1 Tax=unclassified Pseudoalteromonas TaxID=194690 RepID=UPI00041FE597|nr:hypothetical protein [Pseudoalteromonas sp. TB41]